MAFSGGPDSTALAAALARLAPAAGLEILLAHVDHGIDSGSTERAHRAAALALRLGLPLRTIEIDVPARRGKGESPEAAARRLRYAALEELRAELGATRILTAHHRDDQVETVLLRLLRGAPLESLGGIEARRGHLLRPLLGVSRAEIERFLAEMELEPIADPTNADLSLPRNFVRHALLPRLRESEPGLEETLLGLASRSSRLRARLEKEFARRLDLGDGGERDHLLGLPEPLRVPALRWLLHERLGVERLPSFPSMKSFLLLLERKGAPPPLSLPRAQGDFRALVAHGRRLVLETPESRIPPFSYTFSIPGEAELPELGLRLRIRRSPVEPWMLRGDPRRAGFTADGGPATVRNRRPGDRLRPLGSPGTRKLKELLVDRRVPARERDRLPIVEIGGRIAWVPGVALDEAFRLAGDRECWLAELESAADPGRAGTGERKGI